MAEKIKPIERDYTQATIVINGVNSLGEKFHFEIEPGDTKKNNRPQNGRERIHKRKC